VCVERAAHAQVSAKSFSETYYVNRRAAKRLHQRDEGLVDEVVPIAPQCGMLYLGENVDGSRCNKAGRTISFATYDVQICPFIPS
jgi:hypothetical protein